jgi:hypothetical protein
MSRARDADFYQIKGGFRDLFERCGKLARSGRLVGLSTAMMGKVNDREDAAFLSIDATLKLERDCGQPIVTRIMAELLGYRLERIEPAPVEAEGCPLSAHAAVMQEVGDVCRAFAQGQADGRYSRADAISVSRELAELRRTIERFERVNAKTMAGGAE